MDVFEVIRRTGAEVTTNRAQLREADGYYRIIAEVFEGELQLTQEGRALAEVLGAEDISNAIAEAEEADAKPKRTRRARKVDATPVEEPEEEPDMLSALDDLDIDDYQVQ